MPNKLNWAIVGCGWVARDYVAPAIRDASNAQLVALHDPDAQAMARIHTATPSAWPCKTLEQLLQTPDLGAVYIATPNHLHRTLTEACARAGLHVYCEKPMALNAADAQAMVRACETAKVRYATAFDQRFQARHRKLRELVREGELGTITAARIHYACWTPRDWLPPGANAHDNWRVDPLRAGGGAFLDLAPHGLDLTQTLLDDTLETVTALFQKRVFDYAVDDGAVLIGRFQSGALLSMNVAYNCPDTFPRRTLELVGTRAMAVALNTMGQTPGGTLTLINAATGTAREIAIAPNDDISPFQVGIEEFSRCVLSDVPFPFSPQRDLHTMKLLETAQESAKLEGEIARTEESDALSSVDVQQVNAIFDELQALSAMERRWGNATVMNEEAFYVLTTRLKKALPFAMKKREAKARQNSTPQLKIFKALDELERCVENGKGRFFGKVVVNRPEFEVKIAQARAAFHDDLQ